MITKFSSAVLFTAFVSLSAFTTSTIKGKFSKISNIKNSAAAKNADGTTYKLDNATSKLAWLARKTAGEHSGEVKLGNGSFLVENNILKGGSFEIEMNAISNEDETDMDSNKKLVDILKSATFFNTAKFPKANFVITSASKTTGNQYLIKGTLTIKGISNDASFPAVVSINGKKLNATAKITVDRTKYDIKYYSKNFFANLGDHVINDDFDITVNLNANAQ